jgi:hypothetical protein
MQKFVYMILTGSFAIVTAGCGASSFHSPASPVGSSPVAQPAVEEQVATTAFRFAIDQKEVSEEIFNQTISAEFNRTKVSFDFKKISVAEFKLNADHTWVFGGDSASLQISGEVCKEGQTVLQVTDDQGQPSRVLSAAAGLTIPFRMGKVRTLLEMPTHYENPNGLLALSYNLKIEDRKVTLTILKPTAKSQYLAIQADYTPSDCVGR